MRMTQKALLIAGLGLLTVGAQAQQRGIELYFVDTEGGAATLIVTPQKESILIDDGNPGTRDAGRIASAAKLAGLKQIDHLIITHWHLDHYGGTEALAKLIPIKHFYDRGIPDADKSDDPQNFPTLIAAYKAASNNKSNRLSPGDLVPLIRADKKGLPIQLKCLCARTEVLTNSTLTDYPADANAKPIDEGDNAKSLGFRNVKSRRNFYSTGRSMLRPQFETTLKSRPRGRQRIGGESGSEFLSLIQGDLGPQT